MESFLDSELYSSSLVVNVLSYRTESTPILQSLLLRSTAGGVQHYLIQVIKIYNGEQRYMERKMSEFV